MYAYDENLLVSLVFSLSLCVCRIEKLVFSQVEINFHAMDVNVVGVQYQ